MAEQETYRIPVTAEGITAYYNATFSVQKRNGRWTIVERVVDTLSESLEEKIIKSK